MTNRSLGRAALSLIMAGLVFTTTSMSDPVSAATGTFIDDDTSIHEGDIEFVADRDITLGCNPPDNDQYCPERVVTRGEMAAYLARSADVPRRGRKAFQDSSASIFDAEIRLIAAAGITKGCNPPANDKYCPEADVTRGQMAAFLTRAFDLETAPVDYFNDDGSSIFEADINALAHAGITVGCSSTSYCANAPVTRAQMASFIRRSLTGGLEPPVPAPPDGPTPPGEPPADPPAELPAPGAAQPPGSIAIGPGESLAQAVASHSAGTTFYLTSGVHRQVYVRPKDRMTFVGAPGAILSGARVLTSFSQSGGLWLATGQAQHNEEKGTCIDGYSGCQHPEQVFINGAELWQVTSKDEVEPGTFYLDYAQDTIYLADNPNGQLVEASITPVAFDGAAVGVTIRDLVIEKYATPAQIGAIHGQTDRNGPYGSDWLVEGNEIRYNASEGVALGHRMVVRDNYIHHNGRTGVGSGLADGASIVGNEISYNCRGTGFKCFGWGGGGIKIAGAQNTDMISNYVHHNHGGGLHSDVQAVNTTIEGNNVVANDGSGIFIEVSQGATVRDNRVVDNGFARPDARGAGIVISSSIDVFVMGNELIDNALGIVAYEHNRDPGLDRLVVTGNLIVQGDGHNGLRNASGATANFDAISVDWNKNTYDLGTDSRIFVLGSDLLSTAQWLAEGHDAHSIFK